MYLEPGQTRSMNQRALWIKTLLLAALLVGGIVLTHAAQAAANDAPKEGTSAGPKVSPYAKANRERAQAEAASGAKLPQSRAHRGRAGKSGGARQG